MSREPEGDEETKIRVNMEYSFPQADLFQRDSPVIKQGPSEAWSVARTTVDFGCALIAASPEFRADHRIRDAVLLALLRRATITLEGLCHLLAHGLLEPAIGMGRTILEIELSGKLIHRDGSDVMARRLAAYHYYVSQRHGQDMLSNRGTREEVLESADRIEDVIEVSRSFARLLETPAFDSVRESVRKNTYWHGHSGAEAAFKAIGQESDYHMTYDSATWFVHAVNVDFDYQPEAHESPFTLRPLATTDPHLVLTFLGHSLLRYYEFLQVYVEERGIPDTDVFKKNSVARFPGGTIEEFGPLEAVGGAILSAFPPK